jgi:LAO/AO transport system kinase
VRADPDIAALLDQVVSRRLDPASAASAVLTRGGFDAAEAARSDQQPSPAES